MRVNTDELERQAAEIRSIAARLNEIESSVCRVSRILSREQLGMRFQSPLASAARSIRRRVEDMDKMSTGLAQISRLYEQAESRIVDEADEANTHHPEWFFNVIRLPDWIIRPPIPGPGPRPRPFYPFRPEIIQTFLHTVDGETVTETPEDAVCPPLPEIHWDTEERMNMDLDGRIHQMVPGAMDAVLDGIPNIVMPPSPDGIENRLWEVFADLPDGTEIFDGAAAAEIPNNASGVSGLIDWTPWEP